MPTGVIHIQRSATDIQIPIVIQQIRPGAPWARHDGIRADKRPQRRVIVPGVVVVESRAIILLAGEAVVSNNGTAVALVAVDVMSLVGGGAVGCVSIDEPIAFVLRMLQSRQGPQGTYQLLSFSIATTIHHTIQDSKKLAPNIGTM